MPRTGQFLFRLCEEWLALKDVSEYWFRAGDNGPAGSRYHYQGAIFSASEFTTESQDYAFAHDVYLLPLRSSPHFASLLDAIWEAVASLPRTANGQVVGIELGVVRAFVRELLQGYTANAAERLDPGFAWLAPLVDAHAQSRGALIGTIARAFPVLLMPRPNLDISRLPDVVDVRIHIEDRAAASGWRISREDGEVLFTFDLPAELFESYARDGVISRERAADLKANYLREIQAVDATDERMRVLTLRLNIDWLERVRERTRRR
jgi:hypothetical protein